MPTEVEPHIAAAESIYQASENSLMAHTIRATKLRFFEKKLGLDLQIEPDHDGIIAGKAISLLFSSVFQKLVKAKIYIRPDSSRPLARFCIAHEIYHLLLQLDKYDGKYGIFPSQYKLDRAEEDACDGFAWHICRLHNDFYWEDKKLAQCRFGAKPGEFPALFRTHDLGNIDSWPRPFTLDTQRPFWKSL